MICGFFFFFLNLNDMLFFVMELVRKLLFLIRTVVILKDILRVIRNSFHQ